jgi:ParB/RepB/Spo0J family partition protein
MASVKDILNIDAVIKVDPTTIHVDPHRRGRSRNVDVNAIRNLADSIVKDGQIQPIICVMDEDRQLHCVVGFTRLAACKLLHEENDKTTVDVIVKDFSDKSKDEDIFTWTLRENLDRNVTNPIDDAVNQAKLRDEMKWSEARIAAFYHTDRPAISRSRKLLDLASTPKDLVHNGLMPVSAAFYLLDVCETVEDQDALVMKAYEIINENRDTKDEKKYGNDPFKISLQALKAAHAELQAEAKQSKTDDNDDEDEDPKPGKSPSGGNGDATTKPKSHREGLSKPEFMDYLKSEATRGQRWHKEQGYFNAKRQRLTEMILGFIKGDTLLTELNEFLEEMFPHSDEDVAALPEPEPEPVKESKPRGRPKGSKNKVKTS